MKNMIRKLIALALAALLLIAVIPTASAAAERSAEVIVGTMRVYAKANASSDYLGSLKQGTVVTVSAKSGSWSKVHYRGNTGYARTADLSYENLYIGFANTNTAVYAKPDEFAKSIAVKKGFPMYVVGATGDFYAVKNHSGAMGYILKHELSKTLPAGTTPFKNYNPRWEKAPVKPLLMLHAGAKVRNVASSNAEFTWIKRDTACEILGKRGEYYIIINPSNSAIAYLHPTDLYVGVSRAA